MPIEVDFGTELGTVVFPEDYTQDQVFDFVKQNRNEIRQNLIQRRQQEMAGETEQLEAAKFRAGEFGTIETALNTLSELPRGALEGIGQTAKAFARTFEAGDPFTEAPFEQQQRLATQSPIFKAGQAVQEFGQETYPGLPGVRESVPAQIMGGIGSTVSVLPAAAIAGPAGALTGGIAYGLQAGESALDEADTTINRRIAQALANQQYDVAADLQDRREQMKYGAFVTTAPIGAVTEGLLGAAPKVVQRFATGEIGGIGARLAERLVPKSAKFQRKFLGVTGAERVRGAVEALATEGVQESAEQLGGNIAAAAVYDPERGWLDGVAQAGFIGSISGGAVGGLVGSRRNANLANAAAESLGGDPANPLPRANATVAGMEDTQQEGEPEITAEDVLRKSQEAGLPGQEEVVTEPVPVVAAEPIVGVRKTSEFGANKENREYQIDAGGQRAGQANLARNEDGTWRVEMVSVDTPGRGIGPLAYEQIHSELEAEGSGLTSGIAGSLSESAARMWEKLVSMGKAEKTGKTYRMKPTSRAATQVSNQTTLVTPAPAPAVPVDTETGLTPDEQDELDGLITAEDAGTLSEEGAITLAAYRARLGTEPAATQPPTPAPSAVQKQGPDEGVLRREEPQPPVEVGLRQVDQGRRPAEVGGAEAEVTPEEVQQVKAEVVPAPAPAKPRSTTGLAEIGEMGAAIGENLREALWNAFSTGQGPRIALEDSVVKNAKVVAEKTGATIQKTDFITFAEEFSKAESRDEKIAAMQRLASKAAPAPAPAPTPVTPAAQSAKLPKDLAGAKPRYNVSMDAYLPTFSSDFDRAAFIVTQKNPSKRDADYLNWAVSVSGMTPEGVRKHGLQVRAELKKLASQTKGGTSQKPATLTVPSVSISMPEVQVTPAPAPAAPVPSQAPAPAPAPEYTPARINKLLQTLKAKATAVGKGLYEIKKLAPGQRLVLRTRSGGLQETDQFLLREKSQVTGNVYDEGFILRDKQEAAVRPAWAPVITPAAPAPATPTREYTDEDFAAAPSREAAADMAVTQVRTNPSLPPRPPQIFYTLQAVVARANKKPYFPEKLTPELIKQAQYSGLLTAAKNPKLTTAGQQSLADGTRQSEERKAAQANLSDALRERAVLAWDAANDPQSAAYKERNATGATEPTEAELQAAEEARLAQAEQEIDAGPIGQAKQKLEDEGSDMTKRQVKAMARKLEASGVIDDSELDDEGRDTEVDELVGQLLERVEEARDTAIQEREQELADEAKAEKVAPKVAPVAPASAKPISTAPATEPAPAQVQEVKMAPVEKQGTEPLAPKAQKQFLLAQIDEAIAAAPEEATSERIFISVPGDGEFTLLNYKGALTRFKELAKKFPVGPLARESKPRTEAKQAVKLGTITTKNALKASSEMAANPVDRPKSPLTAVFSDGKRVVGSNGKALLQVETNAGGTVEKPVILDESGKPLQFENSYPNVDNVIPKTTTVVSGKINTERLFSVLTQAYQAAYDDNSKDADREANAVIVQNRDGSIGLFSQVPGKTSYSHNVRKGAKVLTSYNIRLLTDLVQAMRRVGVSEFDLSVADEKGRSLREDAGVLTAPGVKGLIMPIRMESYEVPRWASEPDTGRPDSVEAALQKVIAATDPRGKAFEAVAALSNFVVFQASKIALRIYQSTKSWVAARNAGMDYIKSHVQLDNEPETAANFEEHIKAFPNQEIPAGTPERPQPPSPAERVESRGIFRGEVTRDTDENWQSEARKWVDFYKGNLEQAFQGFMGADIDKALREYVGGELLQRSELDVARAKNLIDLLRALNLQARIAAALVQAGSDFGKQGRARQLTFARYAWMVPQLVYRRLINEQQKRKIPFPEITASQVRDWLVESGQQAIDQVKEAMKEADNVFAREFRKIKQVPGEAKGPPIEIKWSEILTKSLQTQGSVRQKMLQVILADPRLKNLSPAGIAEITNLLTTAWENKRNQIFRAEFRKKVPLPTVKPDAREKLFRSLPRILKYANIARAIPGEQVTTEGPDTFLLWEQAFRDAVAPEFGVAEINGLTARKLTELAQKAQSAQGTNRNEIIQQMFRLMAREGGVRFSDVLRDYWYAAVLSGTRTQLDNALNILNGALNTAMLAGLSGKEAGLVARSALKGLDEGIRDFWPMLWRGELYRSVNFNPDQPGNSLEGLGESRNLFAKGLSQAKYVSRLMLALDHVTAMMSDGAAKAYALQKEFTPEVARNLMLPDQKSVQEARDRAIAEGTRPDLVNKRTREILQESFPVDVLMTSKDIREAVTFTEVPQGVMGSLYEGLNAASRKFPALKFLTGTNFVRFAANYTNELLNYAAPIAVYRWIQSAPGKSDQPGGLQYTPARRDLLRAKAVIGSALGATAAALFLGDDDKEEDRDIDITGSFKSLDPNKRKQLLAEGRQPYSIRVGDTYISYRQLGFGGLLGAIGELRDRQLFEPEKWNQEGIIAKVQDAATAGLFIVKDSSAISGLTEFLGFANAYKYDTNEIVEKSAPRYLARLGGSFVPNILKEVDAWSDPSIFKAEPGGLGHEYFLQQVPFARREIGPGPILNVLGEPVRVERYPYSRWVTQRSEDPAWNTLGQLASRGVFMPTPAITVKVNENGTRREMTREEKYAYQRAVGQGYRKFIEQNSKRLLALPPAEAADFIDKNADRIRRNARTNLKNSF